MAERIRIASAELAAEIAPLGAELQSLTDARGREFMSAGDPAFWSGRAPLLFPIVGRLNDDSALIDGHRYQMAKHGFARRSIFTLVEQTRASVLFRLTDSEASRVSYPFAFELDAKFAIDGLTLTMRVTVRNPGDKALPASFGFHPAFAWPLPGAARHAHKIVFEHNEAAMLKAITPDGLIAPSSRASPVQGQVLALADALFTEDALVWDELASRRLTYGAAGGAALDIAFPNMERLGVWTKPGAAFVCIEPWAGIADPEGYSGEFRAKPGVFELASGAERSFTMSITVSG